MSKSDKERLRSKTKLAEELGANAQTVFGDDEFYQIAKYARLSGVTKIGIGYRGAKKRMRI